MRPSCSPTSPADAPPLKRRSSLASSSGSHGRVKVRLFVMMGYSVRRLRRAAVQAAAVHQEFGPAVRPAAALVCGYAQAHDYRPPSTPLDAHSFASEPVQTKPIPLRDPCRERMSSNHLKRLAVFSRTRNCSSIVRCERMVMMEIDRWLEAILQDVRCRAKHNLHSASPETSWPSRDRDWVLGSKLPNVPK